MPAKNRMSVSFSDYEWALLDRLSSHAQKSKAEVVRTIVSEYLAENPNRFRRKSSLGTIRTAPIDAVPNLANDDTQE